MKHIVLFLACLAGFGAWAQQGEGLGLIPTPQRIAYGEGAEGLCPLAGARVEERQVDSLPAACNVDQAYRLTVGRQKGRCVVTLEYVAQEGLANGRLTLEQLRLLHEAVPPCTITDWPAYRYRGWMDDISRGPVTHAAYRERQWRTLHALKYNFCNYYTEHTLYQDEFPDLAPAYARTVRHPDEVINLQLFAHAEKTLRIPFYQYMMDSRANFSPACEQTYEFLQRRIAEAWRQMPFSPFFIIDCDETEQLGTGRARRLVDSLGADEVYVRHINRCYDLVMASAPKIKRPAGASAERPRVVMWGDIVAKNPSMMRQLPPEMVYIMWAYEPLDSYEHLIRPFREHGSAFWVAPSLSHSGNMLPNPGRYMKNIANLARDGWRNGAEGLMNTCWDDNGEALFDNCWHGLFWSAEMAWNPIHTDDPEELRRREEQFNLNFERLFYALAGGAEVEAGAPRTGQLYEVGRLEADPAVGDWYTSAALMRPLLNFGLSDGLAGSGGRAEAVLQMLEEIVVDSAANPHAHYAVARIRATAMKHRLRNLVAMRLAADTVAGGSSRAEEYLDALFDLKREYLRLWDQENGEYERHVVCERYDGLAREVLELDRRVFITVSCDAGQEYPVVGLRTLYDDRPIYYTLDGSEPTASSARYTAPFPLPHSATLRAVSYNQYGEGVISQQYLLSHKAMGAHITLRTEYSTYKPEYSGGGVEAMVDGRLGSNATYADGRWQGYWGDSLDAVIDFGCPQAIHQVSMRFMQNTFDWILAPCEIRVYASDDSLAWYPAGHASYSMDPRETGMRLRQCVVEVDPRSKPRSKSRKRKGAQAEPAMEARYLRVVVPNPGPLPQWHPAPGQPSYLFADEIVVQ